MIFFYPCPRALCFSPLPMSWNIVPQKKVLRGVSRVRIVFTPPADFWTNTDDRRFYVSCSVVFPVEKQIFGFSSAYISKKDRIVTDLYLGSVMPSSCDSFCVRVNLFELINRVYVFVVSTDLEFKARKIQADSGRSKCRICSNSSRRTKSKMLKYELREQISEALTSV